jgi:ABC-type multidrug transport system fused ATPase/permease subunit
MTLLFSKPKTANCHGFARRLLFADTILNTTPNHPEITEKKQWLLLQRNRCSRIYHELPNGYHYNVKERGTLSSQSAN